MFGKENLAIAQPDDRHNAETGPKLSRNPWLEQVIDSLMTRLNVAVVYGGSKDVPNAVIHRTFNARQWKSYEAVANDIADALRALGFRNVDVMPEDLRLADRLRRDNIDLVWLNTGGVQGFNPMAHAASLLEMAGIPYIGHDPFTVGVLDNKHAFKRDLLGWDLPTAPFMTWHMSRGPFRPQVNSQFIRTFKDHWGSFIVKPVSGRASLHVHVAEDESELPSVVAEVFAATNNHVIIEAYLSGREYCVSVAGPTIARDGEVYTGREPFIFSFVERLLGDDEQIFTSMDVRPITGKRFRLLDGDLDREVVAELAEIARAVYFDFNLESIIRLDLREDRQGRISILEANPKPDLKAPQGQQTSLVCAGLAQDGLSYQDLILSLLADRIHFLLKHRANAVPQIAALLE